MEHTTVYSIIVLVNVCSACGYDKQGECMYVSCRISKHSDVAAATLLAAVGTEAFVSPASSSSSSSISASGPSFLLPFLRSSKCNRHSAFASPCSVLTVTASFTPACNGGPCAKRREEVVSLERKEEGRGPPLFHQERSDWDSGRRGGDDRQAVCTVRTVLVLGAILFFFAERRKKNLAEWKFLLRSFRDGQTGKQQQLLSLAE